MKYKTFCKRAAFGLMAASLTLSLTACMDNSSSSESVTEDGKTIIKMGRVTAANSKLPEGDTYENNAYTRLVEEKLDAKIVDQFEAEGEDYNRQVALAIASGELPDMMRVDSREELKELVENDLIADLTEVYDKNASDFIKGVYGTYDNKTLEDATFDGKLMAIPGTIGDSAPNIVWIRKDWVEKLGIKLDADGDRQITLDELESTAKAFVDNDPGATGKPVGIPFASWLNAGDYGGSGMNMTSIAGMFNAHPRMWLEDNKGNIVNGSTTEETKQALGVMADWFKKGIIDPQFGTRTWDDIMALVTNGQTGIVTGPWHIPDWGLSTVRGMDKNAEFAAYGIKGENGKVNVFHSNPTGQFIVVRKDYEHPELAIKILNLFYDEIVNADDLQKDYPEIYKYGELAVDGSTRPFNIEVYKSTNIIDEYKYIQEAVEGKISIDDIPTAGLKIDTESIMAYQNDPEGAGTSEWAKYHSRMLGMSLIDKFTKEEQFNWTTPVFFGNTPTMEKKGANLLKLEEEDFIKIVTGNKPLDYFDTFVANWKKQGGDEIAAEIKEELADK